MSNNKTKFKAIIAKTKLGYTGRLKVYEGSRYLWATSTHVYRLSRLDVLQDIESILNDHYSNYSIAI